MVTLVTGQKVHLKKQEERETEPPNSLPSCCYIWLLDSLERALFFLLLFCHRNERVQSNQTAVHTSLRPPIFIRRKEW